jgi:hypothetical protein
MRKYLDNAFAVPENEGERMIRVEGPDPTAVIKRARDHTEGTVPLILEAAVSLLLGCPLAQDEHVHTLKQSRPGAESLGLYLNDGRQYHFRPGPGRHAATSIRVSSGYRDGESLAELDSREAVREFFGGLRAAP